MGLLRSFCLVAVALAFIICVAWLVRGFPLWTLSPMSVGALVLSAILPLPAYDRERRTRVMAGCILFTIGSALSCVFAVMHDPIIASFGGLAAPFAGVVLSTWAYRTRKRRRLPGLANYYSN